MRKRNCTIVGWVLLLLALSCTEPLPLHDQTEGKDILVRFALSLEGSTTPATKADEATITELKAGDAYFRGLTEIHVLPFSREGAIQSGDEALADARYLSSIPSDGLLEYSGGHLYQNAYLSLPHGTASLLVYGRAPVKKDANWGEPERKHRNGSLSESTWTRAAASVTFTPESIYGGSEVSTSMLSIANTLSYLVYDSQEYHSIQTPSISFYINRNGAKESRTVTLQWNNSVENDALRNCFNWFTSAGQMTSGAGHNVEYMLTTLYARIKTLRTSFSSVPAAEATPFVYTEAGRQYEAFTDQSLQTPLTMETLYISLCDAILARFNSSSLPISKSVGDTITLTGDLHQYPVNYGLPAGAAIVRWKGTTFVPVVSGDFDRITDIRDFCYMPPLYYYANTTIHTSWDETVDTFYDGTAESWQEILGHYSSGNKVVGDTRAVALDDSLQYACSMLIASVRSTVVNLPDKTGQKISVQNAGVFPVTGIIIGGQYQQDLNFAPVTGSDAKEYYLFDNQISGISLKYVSSSSTETLPTFRTLVFPTRERADVYFYMEFRNDSGVSFTGADGVIQPGSHFYLAGKLDFPTTQDTEQQGRYFNRIFTQDHATTVSCIVSSLENAFLSIPAMESQLRLGVKTEVRWTASTPLTIKLE